MNKFKSKNIGILSLNINTPDFNYGAMLHSWAFKEYLLKNELCENVEILDYITPKLEKYDRRHPIISAIKDKNIKKIIKNILIFAPYKSRLKKFDKFIHDNMPTSQIKYTQSILKDSDLKYDTIICESDVIWAPGFFGGEFDEAFFMNLKSMKKMKKIAYAPSMADGDLTSKQMEKMRELLANIDYISCRESYEKDIIAKLSEKQIEHVVDPVMLLDQSDYEKITEKRITDNKYLLLYLPVDNNKKLRKAAKELAKKKQLTIIEISTKCLPSYNHKVIKDASVEQFLSAIKFAEIIFTNSFHAICFSIIFHKEFYAFSRKYSGKVKDICESMNLMDRFFPTDIFEEKTKINYDEIEEKLNSRRIKSDEWIRKSLLT